MSKRTQTMKRLLLAAGLVALSAGAASAQDFTYTWTAAGTLAPTPPAPAFLMFAGAGDLYEIESSRVVLETTANAGLRQFAEMMVTHHSKTAEDAAAAARAAGLQPPPPMLDAPKAAMVEALRGFTGVERDRLYLVQQQMAHKEGLGLQKTYAESGDTPQLRAAAAAAIPIVERHLAALERLMR